MTQSRLQPLLIAALLPLLGFAWFSRPVAGQVDFWLLWLVAMTLVGLPLVFAEVALAQRSRLVPLVGLPKLTREADVPTVWRGFGWLTIVLLALVGGHLLASAGEVLQPILAGQHANGGMAMPVLLAILLLITMAASLAKRWMGWAALVLSTLALITARVHDPSTMWQMTSTSLAEWSLAVVLALVCVGAGTGLFWYSRAQQLQIAGLSDHQASQALVISASRAVLPIWAVQLVVGGLVAMSVAPTTTFARISYALAMLAGSGYLLATLTEQVALFTVQRRFHLLAMVGLAVVMYVLALLPTTWLNQLLILISFISAIWLAVFAGWQMKISHLRKAMNFGSEATYNLWRIAVRIIVPLAILLAVIGWVGSLLT